MRYTVTIAGPTGKTGRHVAAGALARDWAVRTAARRRPPLGTWEPFNWDDEGTWATAFGGSDAAYLLIPFNHPGAAEATPDLIRAVAGAGVTRIVLLSSLDAADADPASPLRQAEAVLQHLPARSAILRPTWFLDNFTTGSFAAMTEAGQLRLPAGNGRIPFIAARDIAEAAVACLADRGPEGVFPLTGPEAVSHHEVAAALSAALSRRISYVPVSPGEFIDMMTGRGFGEDYASFLADALTALADGRVCIPVAGTVKQICGRPPLTVDEFALEYASQRAN
jgi:uncharacterized protein YbjT (DUF2867 family)